MTRNLGSPSALALSGLLTLLFVGCFSDKQSLNSPSAVAGASGEEGTGLGPGVGGSSAGSHAGKGSGSSGKGGSGVVGTGGSSRPDEVGGSSGAGGSGGRGGTDSMGGSGGTGAVNMAGAGFGGVAAGTTGGTAGSFAGDGSIAGAPNGGVPNGGTGGSWVPGMSGAAGYCDSASGDGCDVHNSFCADIRTEGCDPDLEGPCVGHCASAFGPVPCTDVCPESLECLPDSDPDIGHSCAGVDTPSCTANGDCPEGFVCRSSRCAASAALCVGATASGCQAVEPCPPGYTHALVDGCPSVCIPMAHCGCGANTDCPFPSVCDRLERRCKIPAPSPGCSEPFVAQGCNAFGLSGADIPAGTVTGYAYVAGYCGTVLYDGCAANDNLFESMEECLNVCEQRPFAYECPAGRRQAYGCVECGGGGGCKLSGMMCLETCQGDGDCSEAGFNCQDGLCKVGCL